MEIKEVNIKDLKPNPENPRTITKAGMNKIKESIKKHGFVQSITVNSNKDRYNIVIGGHQRLEAAKQLGFKTVPVNYINLSYEEETAFNIFLNNPEAQGKYEDKILAGLLEKLKMQDFDLSLTGFDEPAIDRLLQQLNKERDEALLDTVPELPENPIARPGDVWLLGEHKLICGDSTKPETFKKLMGKEKADLCWTDPPYGVSYKGDNNPNGKDWGVMDNDNLRNNELLIFLSEIFKNVYQYCEDDTALYCCYASVNHNIFEESLNSTGYKVKQELIWQKHLVLGHSDWHWSHEPILYCSRMNQKTKWFGDRSNVTFIENGDVEALKKMTKEEMQKLYIELMENSTVRNDKKDPTAQYVHSTQKPVSLSERMIKNSTAPRSIVLEPCAGSGSTLMACEVSNRKCRAVEINPKYVDVIVKRWEKYTGKKAVKQ